jgi:hypothetical protein
MIKVLGWEKGKTSSISGQESVIEVGMEHRKIETPTHCFLQSRYALV